MRARTNLFIRSGALVLMLVSGGAMARSEDSCGDWIPAKNNANFWLQACTFTTGNSGYIRLQNRSPYTASFDYNAITGEGKRDTGRVTLFPGEKTDGSYCGSCGRTGVVSWTAEKIVVK